MKILVYSDIHKEFSNPFVPDCNDIDVLALAGDTDIGCNSIGMFHDLLGKYKNLNIVFTTGNHEYYNGDMGNLDIRLKDFCNNHPRLHYLQKSNVLIDGVRFIGGTLWTDYNKRDEFAMDVAQQNMSDFRKIRFNNFCSRLNPKKLYYEHQDTKSYILACLKSYKEPCVVLTHHKPFITKDLEWKYQDQDPMLIYSYESDMKEDFDKLKKSQLPEYWIYGHNHTVGDDIIKYKNGKVKFISNCVGYYAYEDTGYTRRIIEVYNG